MRKINLLEIKKVFDDLLEIKILREDASSWAFELQNYRDLDLLEYTPSEDELKIWNAIQFLTGIDLKDSPNEYFHNYKDIKDYRLKL